MGAALELAKLNRSLLKRGQTIVLRRVGTPNVDVSLRGFVRNYAPDELIGGIIQGQSRVVVSGSSVEASGWPGALAQTDGTDPRVPNKGDKIKIAGKWRDVQSAAPVLVDDTLVRIDIEVKG